MVRQKIVGARPDGRISAPARYALLRRSLRDVPQERVLRPAEGGGRIWDPPLHPAGAGTPRRPPRQRAAKRTGRKEEQTKSDRGPVHLPGALCGEQPLHPPGPGTLNGRPGSAQRSGTRGSRNTPIQVSTPSALRPIECGGAVLRGTGPAQGRRGHRSPPDRFARPPHTQTGGPDGPPVCQNGFLFHRARRILFCQDKREWGAHPRRDPAPPEAPAP